MDDLDFTLAGIPGFQELLAGLPSHVVRTALAPAIAEAGALVKESVQSLAHFGKYSEGGLHDSIMFSATQIGGIPSGNVRPNRKKGGGGRHAHLVEFLVAPHDSFYFGHKAHHPGTPGQPFFWRGVEAVGDQAVEILENAMGDAAAQYWESQGGGDAE